MRWAKEGEGVVDLETGGYRNLTHDSVHMEG